MVCTSSQLLPIDIDVYDVYMMYMERYAAYLQSRYRDTCDQVIACIRA